ncbi:MAG TPA: hypothetical protein VGJ28_19220 [Micromonosporaceae bacterium]|jgi:hypothetical protein
MVVGFVLAGGSAVVAAPNPSPSAGGLAIPVSTAAAPSTVCQIGSGGNGAVFLTGLAALKSGYVAVDAANPDWGKYVLYFNSKCIRTNRLSYPGAGAHDPQDVQVDKSGNVWVADSGDASPSDRPFITLWKFPAGGGNVLSYRFTYPDGAHQAKAMVLDGDGRPIFVTQPSSGDGVAGLYEPPSGSLRSGSTVAMTKVGTFKPEQTGTTNKLSISGNLLVTGGADALDGTKVVLRTYSDAYEWSVTNGDVAGAITKNKPIITPLPNEPQGEAIAFTGDGKDFVTVSNVSSATSILKYAPGVAPSPSAKAKAPAGPKKKSAIRKWIDGLTLGQLQLYLGIVAFVGLLLIGFGIWGIVRARRRAPIGTVNANRARPMGQRPDQARTPVPTGGPGGGYGPPGSGYGPGGAPGGAPASGAPASGAPVSPAGGGNVYGGGGRSGGGGNVYGAPTSGAPGRSGPSGGGNVYGGGGGGRSGGGSNVYGSGSPGSGGGGGGPVYGTPRDNQDRGGYDPYASGGRGGGQYSGGTYGTPADPYDGAADFDRGPANRARPSAYPDEYGDYQR